MKDEGIIPLFDIKSIWECHKENALSALKGILDEGRFILGEHTRRLEEKLSSFLDVPYAVTTSSGTSALYLALKSLDIGEGDEVITTPFSFIATIHAILLAGARPVLADIHPGHFNLTAESIEKKISKTTRAVIVVHLFGNPAPISEIKDVCDNRKIDLIEDACQAVGARFKGRCVGTLGTVGTFSFYPTKNLGGAGDGGLLVANDAILSKRILSLRVHGEMDGGIFGSIGINGRMDEMQAALLFIRLKTLCKENEKRQALARFYRDALMDSNIVFQDVLPDAQSVWHLFSILHSNRDKLKRRLEEKGVATGIYYGVPFHLQPHLRYLFYKESLPYVEEVSRRILQIPIYPTLEFKQADYIARAIKESV